MSNPTSNFNWQMPTATDLVTDLPADFEVFGQAVDSTLADLKGGTTGQILSKNSNTDMDFVWTSAAPGDITAVTAGTGISGGGTSGDVTITNSMATAIDAKGDLIAGTGADAFNRLAIGTNDQVLTADSTASTGMKWASLATGSMTSLATGTLTGSSISLTSISQSYKTLYLVLDNVSLNTNGQVGLLVNNDTSGSYNYATMYGGSSSGIARNTTAAYWAITYFNTAAAQDNQQMVITIPNYTNTNSVIIGQSLAGYRAVDSSSWAIDLSNLIITSNSAVTRLDVIATISGAYTFDSGTYTLYGVK